MKFGPASPRDAIGGVTVHTLRQGPLVLKKGTTIGPAEVGLAFVGRYQSMDASDVEAGQFIYGFDAGYEGVLLSAGVRF